MLPRWVYDLTTGEFKPWAECQDVHSFVTTGSNFPAQRPSEDKIQEVKHKLVDSCFTLWKTKPDTEAKVRLDALVTLFLQRLARAVAGHVEDKVWMLWLGMRNSGKGTIIEILTNCFGKKYIHNCESGNLFPKDTSGDSAKLLSWIIAMQFARLGYFNEIPTERDGRAIKCDGTFVKKLASGGDGHTARQNHKDEQDVTIDFTLAVLCNERPDCLQNCQSFLFKGEFKE